MRSTTALLSVLLFATSAQAGDPWGRACRNDLFTVDVPVGLPAALPSLGDMAIQAQPAWFATPCFEPITQVEDVFAGLPPLEGRHYRIHFECDGQVAEVSPEGVCEVIDALDAALANTLEDDVRREVHITRECNGTAQSSPPGTTWQFEAMNAPTVTFSAGFNARIAVVDTQTASPALNSMQHQTPWTLFPLTPKNAPHAHMVIGAIRDLAPAAWIDHFVGLRDPQGGPTSDIAYALRQVIDQLGEVEEPLIVNLSLGWPAEMAVRTLYTADEAFMAEPDNARVRHFDGVLTCIESPVGESVRAALHHLAQSRIGDTVSIASAGNRVVAPTKPGWVVDDGAWEDIGGRFAPSAWASADLKLLSVGASRAGGVAGHGFSNDRLPDLFAPGRHVPVPDPAHAGQRLSISGTSISAAYVSGAAAYLADAPAFLPTPLYNQLLGNARCGAVAANASGTAASGMPGPSYLRLTAETPAVCQSLMAAVPVPQVCTQTACQDRAWGGIGLTGYAGNPAEIDNYTHGTAGPMPIFPICPENDCFGLVDKNTKVMQAWLAMKTYPSNLMSRLKEIEGVSITVFERAPSGKAIPLETVHLTKTHGSGGVSGTQVNGAYELASVALTKLQTGQAIVAGKAEIQLELHWRGKDGQTWTENVALPVHWD